MSGAVVDTGRDGVDCRKKKSEEMEISLNLNSSLQLSKASKATFSAVNQMDGWPALASSWSYELLALPCFGLEGTAFPPAPVVTACAQTNIRAHE